MASARYLKTGSSSQANRGQAAGQNDDGIVTISTTQLMLLPLVRIFAAIRCWPQQAGEQDTADHTRYVPTSSVQRRPRSVRPSRRGARFDADQRQTGQPGSKEGQRRC